MDISCITRNTYPIIPILLLILIITPSSSSSSFSPTDMVTPNLLNELCSEPTTINLGHRFCVKWLTADPRTTSINIHGLIELTVDKTRAFGLENQVLMSDFARNSGNDNQLKNAYESCANSYGISIKELERAKELVSNSSFQLASYAASKALDYAYLCKDQFEGPSNEPILVLNRSEKLIIMCHIAKDFAGLFI